MLRAARPSTANISAAWRGVPLAATGRGYLFTGLSHALPSSSSESPPVNSSNRHTAVGSLQDELYHCTSVISGKGSGVVGRVQRWCSSACRSFSCLYALQTSSAHADGCAFCFCPLPLEVHGRTKAYAARALPDSPEASQRRQAHFPIGVLQERRHIPCRVMQVAETHSSQLSNSTTPFRQWSPSLILQADPSMSPPSRPLHKRRE